MMMPDPSPPPWTAAARWELEGAFARCSHLRSPPLPASTADVTACHTPPARVRASNAHAWDRRPPPPSPDTLGTHVRIVLPATLGEPLGGSSCKAHADARTPPRSVRAETWREHSDSSAPGRDVVALGRADREGLGVRLDGGSDGRGLQWTFGASEQVVARRTQLVPSRMSGLQMDGVLVCGHRVRRLTARKVYATHRGPYVGASSV